MAGLKNNSYLFYKRFNRRKGLENLWETLRDIVPRRYREILEI